VKEETDYVLWFKGLGLNNTEEAWEQLHTTSVCIAASLGDTVTLKEMLKLGIDIHRSMSFSYHYYKEIIFYFISVKKILLFMI
jgi:hypothetical protein